MKAKKDELKSKLISKYIHIDRGNFDFCRDNNIINGTLLLGISKVIDKYIEAYAEQTKGASVTIDSLTRFTDFLRQEKNIQFIPSVFITEYIEQLVND